MDKTNFHIVHAPGILQTLIKRLCFLLVPPSITVRQQSFSTGMGQRVTLECITESYPPSVNYWLHEGRENDEVIQGGSIEQVMMESVYKVIMKLTIGPTKPTDLGTYKCVAKNNLGEAEELITVDRKIKNSITKIKITLIIQFISDHKRVDLLAYYQPNTAYGGYKTNRSAVGRGIEETWKTAAANLLNPTSMGSRTSSPSISMSAALFLCVLFWTMSRVS